MPLELESFQTCIYSLLKRISLPSLTTAIGWPCVWITWKRKLLLFFLKREQSTLLRSLWCVCLCASISTFEPLDRFSRNSLSTWNPFHRHIFTFLQLDLPRFRSLSIFRYSKICKAERFGNWICFRPQMIREAHPLFGFRRERKPQSLDNSYQPETRLCRREKTEKHAIKIVIKLAQTWRWDKKRREIETFGSSI
jgi:hypothetical protein